MFCANNVLAIELHDCKFERYANQSWGSPASFRFVVHLNATPAVRNLPLAEWASLPPTSFFFGDNSTWGYKKYVIPWPSDAPTNENNGNTRFNQDYARWGINWLQIISRSESGQLISGLVNIYTYPVLMSGNESGLIDGRYYGPGSIYGMSPPGPTNFTLGPRSIVMENIPFKDRGADIYFTLTCPTTTTTTTVPPTTTKTTPKPTTTPSPNTSTTRTTTPSPTTRSPKVVCDTRGACLNF